MSFILKALKKVEEEKAAREAGPVDVASALLRGGEAPSRATSRLARWSVIVLAVVAGSALTYLLAPRDTRRSPVIPAQPTNPAAPAAPPPSEPAPAAPVAPAATPRSGMTPDRSEAVAATRRAPEPPPAPTQTIPSQPASGLKVNGIAVQDDPAESVAVVNGALLKRGMTVDGARVEEIFPDRVRFSGEGGSFEVPMSR